MFAPFSFVDYAGYEHSWNDKLSSNFIYSMVQTEELSFTQEETFQWGYTLRSNTFWNAVEGTKLGAEVIWGKRIDKSNINGDALRVNLLFYYDF